MKDLNFDEKSKVLNQKEDVNVPSLIRDIENYRVNKTGWYEDVISKYLPYLFFCSSNLKFFKSFILL